MPNFKSQSSLLRGFCGLILLLVGISGHPAPAAEKTSLAVYPFKAVGTVDKSLAATISSLMNYELSQSPKLLVIKEDMLQEVMKRQAMNVSDLCDSTMCQVEIGKLVAAQKMVIGELSKLGGRYLLTVSLIDIQKGTTEFSTKEQCTCTEDQLDQLAAMASAKMREYFGESGLTKRLAPAPGRAGFDAGASPSESYVSPENAGKMERYCKIFQDCSIEESAEQAAFGKGDCYSLKMKNSKGNRIYVSASIDASPDTVWEVLSNIDAYGEFMPSHLTANILERAPDKAVIQQVANIQTITAEIYFDRAAQKMFYKELENSMTGGLSQASMLRGYRVEPLGDGQTKLIIVQEGKGYDKGECKAIKKRAEALAR